MSPNNQSRDAICKLYDLLGKDAVLLPIPVRKKSPVLKGWQNLTIEQSRDAVHQRRLRMGNVGVLVGKPSNGLCSIDCDSDEILDTFIKLNTALNQTLISKAKRGGNVWVKITGQYPTLKTLKGFGEWRSTGGQTVIAGTHPEGIPYHFINETKVVETEFDKINWPQGISFESKSDAAHPAPPSHSSVSPVSESVSYISASCTSVSLYNNPVKDALEALERSNASDKEFDSWCSNPKNLKISRLYRDLIWSKVVAEPGHRNAVLVALGKKLHNCVSNDVALELLTAFYELNKSLFNDSLEQHIREAKAITSGCENTFQSSINVDERELYLKLTSKHQSTYRILRDLAILDATDNPRGFFFMSADNLGQRIKASCMEADRILKKLIVLKIIKVEKIGERWRANKKAIATEYAWLLPLPPPPLQIINLTHATATPPRLPVPLSDYENDFSPAVPCEDPAELDALEELSQNQLYTESDKDSVHDEEY